MFFVVHRESAIGQLIAEGGGAEVLSAAPNYDRDLFDTLAAAEARVAGRHTLVIVWAVKPWWPRRSAQGKPLWRITALKGSTQHDSGRFNSTCPQ